MIYKDNEKDWLASDTTLDETSAKLILVALENTYSHKTAKGGSWLLLKKFKALVKEFGEYSPPSVEMKIWYFHRDFGRSGDIGGSFVASRDLIDSLIGLEVYYHEYLGKHSEVSWELVESDFTMKGGCHEGEVNKFLKEYPRGYMTTPFAGFNKNQFLQWVTKQARSEKYITLPTVELGTKLYSISPGDQPFTVYGYIKSHTGRYGDFTTEEAEYILRGTEVGVDSVDAIDAREFFRYYDQ